MWYTRKIIHSVGSFFFFFQTKFANSPYSKTNHSRRLRTTMFSSSRFGVRVTALPIFWRIIPILFRYTKLVKQWRVPLQNFSVVRQQIFYRKSWYCPHGHKVFRYPKLMKYWRVLPRNFSALWDKKFSTKKLDTPLSLLSLTFFDNRNFLKHRRVPRRSFSALWDENFSRENRDTLLHKVQKSVVELMFVNFLKTYIKTVVLFLTVCKSWSKYL